MEGFRAEQGVGNICDETLRTLYRTKFHVRYTHKQACKDDNECNNNQNWAGKPGLQNVLATTLVQHTYSMFHL